jgi:hypothetical protein
VAVSGIVQRLVFPALAVKKYGGQQQYPGCEEKQYEMEFALHGGIVSQTATFVP